MYGFGRQDKVKPDAIVGLVLGVVLTYILQCGVGFGGCTTGFLSAGGILQMLLITAIGGAWYHIRGVL